MNADPPKIRCGIVGFGFIGPHHADAIRRLGNVEIVAVASPDIERTRTKAERFGIAKVYGRYEDLLEDADIEVVDIAAPTYLHLPVALAAIARGKHVIVDKPLALSVSEAAELVEAANRAGVVNAITFNYRYNPMVQQARVMIEQGRLERYTWFTATTCRIGCPRNPTSRGGSSRKRAVKPECSRTQVPIGLILWNT